MKQMLAWAGWIVAWALLAAVHAAAAHAAGVPQARDLRQDARAAEAIDGVVLIAFVGQHCGFCARVMNEFLIPMSADPQYRQKVVMRQVETRSREPMRDFSGRMTTQQQFARQHGIQVVPTIAVFDRQGRMLGKPLIGLTLVDYYGLYLDDLINAGLNEVRAQNPDREG